VSFKNVYGHKEVIDFFQKVIKNNNLSHSYVFDGLKGIGKKHFAINLSKTIFCKNNTLDACEVCDQCKKINHGNHLDFLIIEPDGSSIKNEQIKNFQEFLSYKPNESKKKIVIINDSNLMTVSAQNTILKILEEPPAYALIIFISQNSNKLLETIQSRCQIIRFNPLKKSIIENYLMKEEGLDREGAEFIANFSNGNFSKAYKAAGNKEFLEIRNEIIDYTNELLLNKKIKSIQGIEIFQKNKKDIELIFDIMIGWIRDILIVQRTNDYDIVMNRDKIDRIKKQAYRLVDRDLVSIIQLIEETIKNIEMNVNFKLAIDHLVLEIIQVGGTS
jgi:DNA polymerase-3 subunit delta'